LTRSISFYGDIAYVMRGISCSAKAKRFIRRSWHCPPIWGCSIVSLRILWRVKDGLSHVGRF